MEWLLTGNGRVVLAFLAVAGILLVYLRKYGEKPKEVREAEAAAAEAHDILSIADADDLIAFAERNFVSGAEADLLLTKAMEFRSYLSPLDWVEIYHAILDNETAKTTARKMAGEIAIAEYAHVGEKEGVGK